MAAPGLDLLEGARGVVEREGLRHVGLERAVLEPNLAAGLELLPAELRSNPLVPIRSYDHARTGDKKLSLLENIVPGLEKCCTLF